MVICEKPVRQQKSISESKCGLIILEYMAYAQLLHKWNINQKCFKLSDWRKCIPSRRVKGAGIGIFNIQYSKKLYFKSTHCEILWFSRHKTKPVSKKNK